jgi:uracil-DNA glycosylase family 4
MPTPDQLLESLAEEVRACRLCALGDQRKNAVPGEGSARAKVMFIGEAPGADEDEQGRPFVGRAGQLLRQLIDRINLDGGEYFIGNTLKCRPPGNRDPEPLEIESCKKWLFAQLAVIKPLVVVILGRHSMGLLLGPKLQISKARGQVFERDGMHFLPMYHPAAILRNPNLRKDIVADFDKLALLLKELEQ